MYQSHRIDTMLTGQQKDLIKTPSLWYIAEYYIILCNQFSIFPGLLDLTLIDSNMHLLIFLCLGFSSSFAQTSLILKETNESYQFYLDKQLNPVLSLDKLKPFIQIAQAHSKVKEVYGFFKFKEKKSNFCRRSHIDSILKSAHQIQLLGHSCSVAFRLLISAIDKHTLDVQLEILDSNYNRVYLTLQSPVDEKIYGLGEQYSYSNLKGKKIPIII